MKKKFNKLDIEERQSYFQKVYDYELGITSGVLEHFHKSFKIDTTINAISVSDQKQLFEEQIFKYFLIAVLHHSENTKSKNTIDKDLFSEDNNSTHTNTSTMEELEPPQASIEDKKTLTYNKVASDLLEKMPQIKSIISKKLNEKTSTSGGRPVEPKTASKQIFPDLNKIDFEKLFISELTTEDKDEFKAVLRDYIYTDLGKNVGTTHISKTSEEVLTDEEKNDKEPHLISLIFNNEPKDTKPKVSENRIRISSLEEFNIKYGDLDSWAPDKEPKLPLKTDEEKNIFDIVADSFEFVFSKVPQICTCLCCLSDRKIKPPNKSPSPQTPQQTDQAIFSAFFWQDKFSSSNKQPTK